MNEEEIDKHVRLRIQHTLKIFPVLSHSMLQQGVGTGFPAKMWAPILENMVNDGEVHRTHRTMKHPATGREQTYTLFTLPEHTHLAEFQPAYDVG